MQEHRNSHVRLAYRMPRPSRGVRPDVRGILENYSSCVELDRVLPEKATLYIEVVQSNVQRKKKIQPTQSKPHPHLRDHAAPTRATTHLRSTPSSTDALPTKAPQTVRTRAQKKRSEGGAVHATPPHPEESGTLTHLGKRRSREDDAEGADRTVLKRNNAQQTSSQTSSQRAQSAPTFQASGVTARHHCA
jgi:hypothetical protein